MSHHTKVFRFRMRPTAQQAAELLHMAGARRWVWNWALARRKAHYEQYRSVSPRHAQRASAGPAGHLGANAGLGQTSQARRPPSRSRGKYRVATRPRRRLHTRNSAHTDGQYSSNRRLPELQIECRWPHQEWSRPKRRLRGSGVRV